MLAMWCGFAIRLLADKGLVKSVSIRRVTVLLELMGVSK
ncbi:hypothetical protein RCH06_002857 [Polaromonas sp. CG_9.5]|nr:hypothetical protein [Polaromonas sp. CG_9.5]